MCNQLEYLQLVCECECVFGHVGFEHLPEVVAEIKTVLITDWWI